MKSKSKVLPYVVFGVPILIGLYFVYRAISKGRKGKDSTKEGGYTSQSNTQVVTSQSGGNTVSTPKVVEYFPLKKGSKGAKVKDLQKALFALGRTDVGNPPDGDFGPITERELVKETGKKSVESQSELDDLVKKSGNRKAEKEAYEKNGIISDKLIGIFLDAKNKGKRPFFSVFSPSSDSGLWNITTDGRSVFQNVRKLPKNEIIPSAWDNLVNDIQDFTFDTNSYGYILITYKTSKGQKIKVSLNPNDVQVIS